MPEVRTEDDHRTGVIRRHRFEYRGSLLLAKVIALIFTELPVVAPALGLAHHERRELFEQLEQTPFA